MMLGSLFACFSRQFAVATVCGLAFSTTAASQVLDPDDDTLTVTPSLLSRSRLNDFRQAAVLRGTRLDGGTAHSGTAPLRIAANPGASSWNANGSLGGVDLGSGYYSPSDVDIALPAPGFSWVVGRSVVPANDDTDPNANGPQGINWMQSSQVEIVFMDDATNANDTVRLIYGGSAFADFVRGSSTNNEFKGVNGAAGVFKYVAGSPDTWTYTDPAGMQAVFFGGNTSTHKADWQIWKYVDPAGNTAYVGDATTASTAVSNGYDSAGRILYAYDSADRRYTYTYSTIDSVTRLTQVKAETRTGGTWASPSGLATVAQVDYAFYQTGDNTYGDNGCLKQVAVTTPLSDPSQSIVRKTLYRYYTGAYDASTNPGAAKQIKIVVGAEGVRNYDWGVDGALDDDQFTASTATLKPYSDAYVEYDSSRRVSKIFFNGQCGCSGGNNGTYEMAYSANGSFSNTSGYDTAWKSRTIVKRPDATYVTQYFDEVNQPLSRVVTNTDPAGTPTQTWATAVTRSSGGAVSSVATPANATGYTHSTGAITSSSSAGLVNTGGSDTAFYDVELAYDRNSNITLTEDKIQHNGGANETFSAQYSMDNLNRLIRAEEGNWSGSVINNRTRDEQWTLSPTGNFSRRKIDLNGDGSFSGTDEIDDTGTFNKANEWLTRDTDSNGSTNYTLTHDAVGQLTDDGKDYKYKYDGFGRLKEVKNQSNNLVAEYRYNGLGYRIGWHYDVNASGAVDGSDPWYYFVYDERWRPVATYRGSDSDPKEQFVFHAAGKGGMGGSSYIDSVVLRDKDANSAWTSASDGTLEDRIYYCQNWRNDVSVLVKPDSGNGLEIVEWIKYSAYGVPYCIAAADYNRSGATDTADSTAFDTDFNNTNARADVNFDGTVDLADFFTFYNAHASAGSGGRNVASQAGVGNRIGYAGYQFDPSAYVLHVRHRVFLYELGQWNRRDPLGYIELPNVYWYVHNAPTVAVDSQGLYAIRQTVPPDLQEIDPRLDPEQNPRRWTIGDPKRTRHYKSLGNCWRFATCKPMSTPIDFGENPTSENLDEHQSGPDGINDPANWININGCTLLPCTKAMSLTLADACIRAANPDGSCDAGYRIAVLADTGDYHYVREKGDPGSGWEHKRGPLPVTDSDCAGHKIVDPRSANWNCGKGDDGCPRNYKFCGFVCRVVCQ